MRPAPRLNRRFGLWVHEMTAGEKGPGKQTKGRDTRWKKRAKTAAHRISLLNAPPSEGACRGRQRLLKLSRLLTRSGKAYGFRVNSFNGPISSCAPDQAAWNRQPRRLCPVWKPREASADSRLEAKFSSVPHSNRRSILPPPEPTAVTRGASLAGGDHRRQSYPDAHPEKGLVAYPCVHPSICAGAGGFRHRVTGMSAIQISRAAASARVWRGAASHT